MILKADSAMTNVPADSIVCLRFDRRKPRIYITNVHSLTSRHVLLLSLILLLVILQNRNRRSPERSCPFYGALPSVNGASVPTIVSFTALLL